MILLDNNILARLTNDGHTSCQRTRDVVHKLLRRGEVLVICPQAIYEFWAVATRSKSGNGLGLSESQVSQWISFFRRRFCFLPDRPELAETFTELVRAKSVRGFRAHDARYVAFAHTQGIACLLTFNGQDFQGLPVTLLDPNQI